MGVGTCGPYLQNPIRGVKLEGWVRYWAFPRQNKDVLVQEVRNSSEDISLSCRHLYIRGWSSTQEIADSWEQWDWSLSEPNVETDWGVTYKGKTKGTLRVMCKKGRMLGRGPHRCELPVSRGCKRRSVERQRGRTSTISWKSQNLLPVSHGKSRAHSFGTTWHRGSQRVLHCVAL